MDTLQAIGIFVRAVELGSLSSVARERGTTQPTISKTIAWLEKDIGARLLNRTTKRVVATDEGQRLYGRGKQLLEQHAEVVRDTRGLSETASGLLRVNAPIAIGQLRLNRLVVEFLEAHPDIQIELILNDRFVDLTEEGGDVALRLGGTPPQNAVARTVAMTKRFFVGSPSYLQSHAAIRRPADLGNHQCVQFAWATALNVADLRGPEDRRETIAISGRYKVNSSLAIREALLIGAGIGAAPGWLVQDLMDSGELVRILPRWDLSPQLAHVVYRAQRYRPHRIRAFVEFLAERVPCLPGLSLPTAR